jgi:hypothetical protein
VRLESSIKQPILHTNYYGNTKETRTDNIYTYEYTFTYTLLFLNAHKRSKLISSLVVVVPKFPINKIKMYYDYDITVSKFTISIF